MTPNRLAPIRAIFLACAVTLILAFGGCASRPASAIANDSVGLSATVPGVVSPTSATQSGSSLDATATADPGTATPGPGGVANVSSATAFPTTAASTNAQPTETSATATQDAVPTPSAARTPGDAPADSSVPLFLTVTAPADELLEVPAGTASVTISGKTVPSAVLSVNGNLVIPDSSGNFQVTVPVDDDVTLVEVVASDVTGAELHVQRVIVRD